MKAVPRRAGRSTRHCYPLRVRTIQIRTPLCLLVVACLAMACGPTTGSPSASALLPTDRSVDSASPPGSPPAETAFASAVASASTPVATPTAAPELSAAESQLLEELRADSRIGCAPRRADLPPESSVGVECRLDTALVERVGVYGFPAFDGLGTSAIGAYLARLEERGVPLRSGDCQAGEPGDASWPEYLPDEGPEGAGPSETRIGCFHDENGTANVRLTCYGEVYIGILGKGRDIAPLYRWAMRVAAGESTQRDPPGICARPD
jgi:hypothetical protein